MAKKRSIKTADKAAIEKEILNGLCPICHKPLIDGQIIEVVDGSKTVKIHKSHRLMLG